MDKTLVIILGPHAVGKMTVGQELAKITGLRLFHNHMSIELTRKLFDRSEPEWQELNQAIRQKVFELFAKGDFEGLIFTYMFDFDMQSEYDYISEKMNNLTYKGFSQEELMMYENMLIRIKKNLEDYIENGENND